MSIVQNVHLFPDFEVFCKEIHHTYLTSIQAFEMKTTIAFLFLTTVTFVQGGNFTHLIIITHDLIFNTLFVKKDCDDLLCQIIKYP